MTTTPSDPTIALPGRPDGQWALLAGAGPRSGTGAWSLWLGTWSPSFTNGKR